MKYAHYILKRKIEAIFIYPFILLGNIIAFIKPLKKQYDIFFFFPFYHTGGAEKVHALIAQAVGNKNCIIYFTRTSADNTFYKDFENSGCTIKNIAAFTDNKWLYFLNLIYRGIITSYINHQTKKPKVFNGQCNFAYKISPWIKTDIRQYELIHSFNSFSYIRIPFANFYEKTIMISKVRINNHLQHYQQIQAPQRLQRKIIYISNAINLPIHIPPKNYNNGLQVLFVGRGTPEKRANLFASIAALVHTTHNNINFTMVGNVEKAIHPTLLPHVLLAGNIHNEFALSQYYQQAHIVVITSNTEGFPMVVMEAMSYGCAILATPVGDIPLHIKNGENGFVTGSIQEEICLQELSAYIIQLANNSSLLELMYNNNIQYAQQHFGMQQFKQAYANLLQ